MKARHLGGLALYVLVSASGNALLAYGMKQRPVEGAWVALAVAVLALSYWMYLRLLRHLPLSVAGPAGASTYLFTTALAQWALHEAIPPLRWTGAVLVAVGVMMVLLSNQPHRRPAAADERVEG
jgi:drug/metabolite transporter (DMT)-like permease